MKYACGNCGVEFEAEPPVIITIIKLETSQHVPPMRFDFDTVNGYLCENCAACALPLLARFGTNSPPHLGLG